MWEIEQQAKTAIGANLANGEIISRSDRTLKENLLAKASWHRFEAERLEKLASDSQSKTLADFKQSELREMLSL